MKKLNLLKVIKAKCLYCCNNNKTELMLCPIKDCPLWVYRKGKLNNG